MEPRSAAALRVAAVVAVYAAIGRVLLAPIFNFGKLTSANYGGDARLIIWTLAWDNHAVLDHVRPLFDANIFYPAANALAYSEHLFGISLFTLPVYAMTRNPVLAYNVAWLACYLFSALAAHLLAWRHTRDHMASFVAGVAFAFCFFRMHHGHGHLHVIWAFWVPVSLIAMDRWIERPTTRRAAVFTIVITLQALASWYQAVLIVLADALFLAWTASAERRFAGVDERTRLTRFGMQACGGAAAALACVWPFARHYTVLSSVAPREAVGNAADAIGYLVPPENTIAGQWLLAHGIAGPRWIWGEQTVYIGWTVLILAAVGAALAVRSRDTDHRRLGYYVLLALASIALALGPSAHEVATNRWGWSPYGLLMHLPGVALFRAPARFSELLTLAVAMLAAAACAALHRRWQTAGPIFSTAALVLFMLESYVVKFPGGQPQPYPTPKIYRQLAAMPAGAVVSLPDYAGTNAWFVEADYQYFSMAHWRPIANGYSRAEPEGFRPLIDRLKTFPSPSCAAAMRAVKIQYMIVHAGSMPNGTSVVTSALRDSEFRLAARVGDDYLFTLHGGAQEAGSPTHGAAK